MSIGTRCMDIYIPFQSKTVIQYILNSRLNADPDLSSVGGES